jgi:ribose 5-phosphate isomerase A
MFADLSPADQAKYVAAKRAVEFVEDGMKLGLGTGSTAAWMVRCLADRVKTEGLRIQGVPTSTRTADLARELGLDVVSLDQAGHLDITIDGTDEFDRALNLIKGGGGALLQEKIVASASDQMIVIADFDKHVPHLGKFPLPVEVLGFGLASSREHIARLLADHGLVDRDITMRMQGDAPFVTDEGNFILDLHLEQIPDAPALAIALNQVPGVVENGLFIHICDRVILGASDGRIEEHVRP